MSPVLLVERLTPATFLLALGMRRNWREGYYLRAQWLFRRRWVERLLEKRCGLRQWRYEDAPGSYFQSQSLACEAAPTVFENAWKGCSPLWGCLNAAGEETLFLVALQRLWLDLEGLPMAKTLLALSHLESGNGSVFFFPMSDRAAATWAPEPLVSVWGRAVQPWPARALAFCRRHIVPLTAIAWSVGAVLYLLFQRGLCVFRNAQRWRLGFDVFNEGFSWAKPYHDRFLYESGDFAPQAILHVVRNRLKDQRTQRFFQEHGVPFVESSRLSIPMGYFFQRLLGKYLVGFLWRCLWLAGRGDDVGLSWAVAHLLFANLSRAEIMEFHHRPDVFLARDEYSQYHILRTILAHRRGSWTVGFSHGDDCARTVGTSHLAFNVFCFPGNFHRKLLAKSTEHCGEARVIGAGVYGLDETHRLLASEPPNHYRDLRKKFRLVGLMASTYSDDFFLTRASTLRFYRAGLSLLDQFPDMALVIKPKVTHAECDDPEFQALWRAAGPRAVLDLETWTYDLLPHLDAVICIGVSSIGLETTMTGRPVIYYDEGELDPHPYGRYHFQWVARSPSELTARVAAVLQGRHVPTAIVEEVRQSHGLQFDGQVVARLREAVKEGLVATRESFFPSVP